LHSLQLAAVIVTRPRSGTPASALRGGKPVRRPPSTQLRNILEGTVPTKREEFHGRHPLKCVTS